MRRGFALTHRVERWTRARFTPTGRVLLGALVAVGLFSLNPRASSAYQLSVILIAIVVAAMLWAPAFRPRLRLERQLPRFASVGTPLRYHVLARNEGRRAVRGAALGEWLTVSARDVPASVRGGYPGFLRALARAQGFRAEPAAMPDLAPGAQARVAMTLLPLRRGYLVLTHLVVSRADPLGVFNAIRRHALRDRVLCLPERFPVDLRAHRGRAREGAAGTARSDVTGAGLDFARLREYRRGDPLRHIDWRAWARIGEPVVKEFHEEAPSRSALILDTALPSGRDSELFETAVSIAASFAGDPSWCVGRLDLLFAGEDLLRAARGREREGTVRMLEALALVQPSGAERFVRMSELVRRALGLFSQCVCVLLDLDDSRRALLETLEATGCELTVLVVRPSAGAAVSEHVRDASVIVVSPDTVREVLAGLAERGAAAPVAAHG